MTEGAGGGGDSGDAARRGTESKWLGTAGAAGVAAAA